jgi:hypothetical protein
MSDLDAKRKKNDSSELGRARDLLRAWLWLPGIILFLLVAAFIGTWAGLRILDARNAEAQVIAFLVSGLAIGVGVYAIRRQVLRTRALIERINDMEQEHERLTTLADVDASRLEMPHIEIEPLDDRDNHRERQSR